MLFVVTPPGDGVQLLYTSKDDWGGFLRPQNSAKGVGHLKSADLKLLKFAHNELLKEKEDHIKADTQVVAKPIPLSTPVDSFMMIIFTPYFVVSGPGSAESARGQESRRSSGSRPCFRIPGELAVSLSTPPPCNRRQ